jgi:hypothetical protein
MNIQAKRQPILGCRSVLGSFMRKADCTLIAHRYPAAHPAQGLECEVQKTPRKGKSRLPRLDAHVSSSVNTTRALTQKNLKTPRV